MNEDLLRKIYLLDYDYKCSIMTFRMIGVSFHKLLFIIALGVCLFYFGFSWLGDQDNVRIRNNCNYN